MSKVHFINVSDGPSKLQAITQTVQECLDHEKRVLIAVPNQEAANFIDRLLWTTPEESFSPHAIVNGPSQELVAITTSPTNFNKAQVLINLNPHISPISSEFEVIYDLYDKTHPSKETLSQQRQEAYTSAGL